MPLTDPLLCDFPSVVLEEGVGKYVQIELRNPGTGKERMVIRHDVESDFHVEVAEKTVREAEFKGVAVSILGGGRISVSGLASGAPKVHVYGYSMQFGRADHELTEGFIKEAYPNAEVTWANTGY